MGIYLGKIPKNIIKKHDYEVYYTKFENINENSYIVSVDGVVTFNSDVEIWKKFLNVKSIHLKFKPINKSAHIYCTGDIRNLLREIDNSELICIINNGTNKYIMGLKNGCWVKCTKIDTNKPESYIRIDESYATDLPKISEETYDSIVKNINNIK